MSSVSQIYFNKPINEVTLEDVEKLIEDRVMEDYTLDYKEIPKREKYDSYAKVISSFLNTKGGILVIGVSESKGYPKEITWGKFTKETLIRNLYRKVDPWTEEIIIQVIDNPEDDSERIFIVEVPKGRSPPYMGNGVYPYRNVYESIPMTHSQVRTIFMESYLAKEDIIEKVIQPIYVHITEILENRTPPIETMYGERGYEIATTEERYLYDQINPELRKQIDEFFRLVEQRDDTKRNLGEYFSDQMKLAIVEFSKGTITIEDIINKVDLLHTSYQTRNGLKLQTKHPKLFDCILHNISPFHEAGETPTEGFMAGIKNYNELSREDFLDLFIKIKYSTQESPLFTLWHETDKEIESLGNELITLLQNY